MSTQAVERFLALLTLVAMAVVMARVAVMVLRRTGSASTVDAWLHSVADLAMPAAFAVAATTMLGSLYFSESAHFTPCRLCWFQRIGLYPVAIILGFGLLTRDRSMAKPALLMALLTAPISAYHYLIEWYPTLEQGSCDPTAPCTAVWFREFGFISLPFMALVSALAVISLLTLPRPTHRLSPSAIDDRNDA